MALNINANDNLTIFGKSFIGITEKCPLEKALNIKQKKRKNNFAHKEAYCCRKGFEKR